MILGLAALMILGPFGMAQGIQTAAAADTTPSPITDTLVQKEAAEDLDTQVTPAGGFSAAMTQSMTGGMQQIPRAPRFTFGATVLIGMNHLHYTEGAVTGKSALAFGAGLYGQLNMGFVALRPEVLYERNQARHPDGRVKPNAVTVPVSLVFQVPESIPYGVFVSVGGYFSHVFSGEQGDREMDFRRKYYRNEAGITWGVGTRVGRVTFGVFKRYGLTDLLRSPGKEANLRNRAFQARISCRF